MRETGERGLACPAQRTGGVRVLGARREVARDNGSRAGSGLLADRRLRLVLIGCLLVGGLLLRLPGIDEPSIEQRETQSALLARQWYLGDGSQLPVWKQRVLAEVRRSVRPIEPPILDYLSALQFRLGGENFWFPRLLSSLAWVLGGIFLYLIATRLTTPDGAVIALALYLAWPFAVWLSRHFMPDALMVFCLLAAVLAVVRHWELPSRQRFLAAAAVSSLATLIKPGVAFAYLVAVFAALAVSRRGLRALPRWGGQLAGFASLAALPALAYYVAGTRLADFINSSADTARLTPGKVATAPFWEGWWDAVSYLLRYPQTQELLAVLPLAAALGGFALVRSGPPRALLGGLGLGYLAFAWTFATYASANPYYSLPLIPILALAIGVLGGATAERLRRLSPRAPYALTALVAAVLGIAAYKSHAVMRLPIPPTAIRDYRRIGELTGHTTRAIVVDNELRHPAMYWGWIGARTWDLADDFPPASIEPERADYLVVVGVGQLESSPGLRRFARGLPVVASTPRYAIFDLRGRNR